MSKVKAHVSVRAAYMLILSTRPSIEMRVVRSRNTQFRNTIITSAALPPHCHVIIPESVPLHRSVSSNQKQVASYNLPSCLVAVEFDVKVKVKFTLEQARKFQRGSRGIALHFH